MPFVSQFNVLLLITANYYKDKARKDTHFLDIFLGVIAACVDTFVVCYTFIMWVSISFCIKKFLKEKKIFRKKPNFTLTLLLFVLVYQLSG